MLSIPPRSARASERWQTSYAALEATLRARGIEPAGDDLDVLDWIASWEPRTVAVICRWLSPADDAEAPR